MKARRGAAVVEVPRDGNAGRPVPLPEGERCYLYVTEAEIQQLAEGIVPEVVRTQAQVALMSTTEWIVWIREKDEKNFTRVDRERLSQRPRTAAPDGR